MKRIVKTCSLGMFLGVLCVVVACVDPGGDDAADTAAPATTAQRLTVQSVSDDAADPDGTIEQSSIEPRNSCTVKFCRACVLAGGDCENEGTLGCFCI